MNPVAAELTHYTLSSWTRLYLINMSQLRLAMSNLPHAAEIACLVDIRPSSRPGSGLDRLGVRFRSHGSNGNNRVVTGPLVSQSTRRSNSKV